MNKILRYELRRLLWNKYFLGLLAINGAYAWYTLTSDTIAGIAYTAPFSPWSFGAYLSSTLPVMMRTVLFLLSFFHSAKEKQVEVLTSATPVNAVRFMLVRLLAVTLGFLLLCLLTLGMCMYFYAAFFDYWAYAGFIIPFAITVLPCFAFTLGAGNYVGRIRPRFIYVMMLAFFVMTFLQIPGGYDVTGGAYYSNYSLSLPVGMDGEPDFVLSAGFLTARISYLVIGIALLMVNVRRVKH